MPLRSDPWMNRDTSDPRVSAAVPSISDAAAFMARISFFSSVTTIASGTTLITAASCASAATFARVLARFRPTRIPIQISMMSAKTQNAANATRAGVLIHVKTSATGRSPLLAVVLGVVEVALVAGVVDRLAVPPTVAGRAAGGVAGVLVLPFVPFSWPLACGVVGTPVTVGDGNGAVLDAGHAGPTLSKPVW